MIALITGINGQDGSFLAELLLSKDYEVHGLIRRSSTNNLDRIKHILSRIHLHYGDLSDSLSLIKIIQEIKPNEIYNLAAQSDVKASFDIPEYTSDIDALGTLRLLEACRICGIEKTVKFYQASTSELFGKVEAFPQSETTPFYPYSPYAIAKQYSYWIVKQDYIELGNLNSLRDWGYAKDYVKAMWLMLQHEQPEDFVIATGEQHSIREFVNEAFKYYGIEIIWQGEGIDEVGVDKTTGKILVKINPQFFRPTEVDNLCGDASKAKNILGWKPTTSFKELVQIMVQHDEERISNEKNI